MAIRPWFPFWLDDWLSSTDIEAMSAAQERGFLRWMAHCWKGPECSLSSDKETLWKLGKFSDGFECRCGTNCTPNPESKCGSKCFSFAFSLLVSHPVLSSRLTCRKLHEEYVKAVEISDKRKESGTRGGRKSKKEANASRLLPENTTSEEAKTKQLPGTLHTPQEYPPTPLEGGIAGGGKLSTEPEAVVDNSITRFRKFFTEEHTKAGHGIFHWRAADATIAEGLLATYSTDAMRADLARRVLAFLSDRDEFLVKTRSYNLAMFESRVSKYATPPPGSETPKPKPPKYARPLAYTEPARVPPADTGVEIGGAFEASMKPKPTGTEGKPDG